MSTLERKLKENLNRRRRESMLAAIDERLHRLLAHTEFSSDVNVIRNAAFSTWDSERDSWTTTRGPIDN